MEVVLDAHAHFILTETAAQAVDLRPARDAGLDDVAARVERNGALESLIMCQRMRARPDERHVAEENVDELRQLVDVVAAHEAAETRHPRIARHGLSHLRAILHSQHRAELEDAEMPLIVAIAALPEYHRPRAVEFDRDGDHQHHRREYEEADAGKRNVHCA